MTGEDLLNSMEYVDGELVLAVENPGWRKRFPWKGVVAACIALVILVGSVLQGGPVVFLLAGQVGNVFEDHQTLGPTNQYRTLFLRNGATWELRPLPEDTFLPIYLRNDGDYSASEQTLAQWKAEIQQRLPMYLPSIDPLGGAMVSNGDRGLSYSIGRNLSPGETEVYGISAGGKKLSIDQTQSDEQILVSLEWWKERLFGAFAVDFPDSKVVRVGNNPVYGVQTLTVYYYDSDAHPLNAFHDQPLTDYVCISFDNYKNFEGDILSPDILSNAFVQYMDVRAPRYSGAVAYGKRISLEKAEKMLEKGYGFTRSDCPACTAMQSGVDFSDYDYVGYEYVSGNYKGDGWTLTIPCYTFYKKIEDREDGAVYAKTYVCAIETIGMELYFGLHFDLHFD